MSRVLLVLLVASLLVSCAPQNPPTSTLLNPTTEPAAPGQLLPTSSADGLTQNVPAFGHIVIILFENEDFKTVIGNADMPFFNQLAQQYTLLTGYYAVRHPSLPNYIALIGGDTFGIDRDCNDCFVDATSLPDLIEASGRSWKAYQESMPKPCYVGDRYPYAQKHNPFIYFDSVRLDKERCDRSIVPLAQLKADLQAGTLPDFMFITPNLCNDAHDCALNVADKWLENQLNTLMPALDKNGQPYLIVLAFDEGTRKHSVLGLQKENGGRIPVVLVSSAAKSAFQDSTPYNHYSLLKTIAASWGLGYLGHAKDEKNILITTPWK